MFVPTRRTDDALTPAGKFHLNIAEMVALQSMDDPAWPRDRPYPDAVAGTVAAVAELRLRRRRHARQLELGGRLDDLHTRRGRTGGVSANFRRRRRRTRDMWSSAWPPLDAAHTDAD